MKNYFSDFIDLEKQGFRFMKNHWKGYILTNVIFTAIYVILWSIKNGYTEIDLPKLNLRKKNKKH